jgi:hypothetical protein
LQSSAGETALHLATLNGHFSVVEFLLLEKADPNLTNSSGTCQTSLSSLTLLLLLGHALALTDPSLLRLIGKKPRDYARKKDMRDLYAKAERGELDLDKTTERTAAALVQRCPSPPRARAVVRVRCSRPTHRDNKGPGFNPSNKMLGDLVTAGFEQALVLQCMYRLFEKGYVADLT